ncbi:phosphotransferase family protein [Kribbella sp. DT2]|uniref:phosphotransferase family protein n=1 Tax=Kribbella sp. DT2 TaxID=3393427 RepID=UPI003CE8B0D4
MPKTFTKRREAAAPGSIPDRLQTFTREVRFYREIGPAVGVRVPACFHAEEVDGATHLELEDLSDWQLGADPADAARLLAALHQRWEGKALTEWPWLAQAEASDLVDQLFRDAWATTRTRADLTAQVRTLGDDLVGQVPALEQRATAAGPPTLVHGDASARNMRTSPTGEIALLDWEDLRIGSGLDDLAWFLVSSVEPPRWAETITAYGGTADLRDTLPAMAVQGLFSFSDEPESSPAAQRWIARLTETARRIAD